MSDLDQRLCCSTQFLVGLSGSHYFGFTDKVGWASEKTAARVTEIERVLCMCTYSVKSLILVCAHSKSGVDRVKSLKTSVKNLSQSLSQEPQSKASVKSPILLCARTLGIRKYSVKSPILACAHSKSGFDRVNSPHQKPQSKA